MRGVGALGLVNTNFDMSLNTCDCQSFLFANECTSDCLKNNLKIYIKTAPTCFGAVTPSSGSSLSVLAKVTLC
jgi:hypothetical protein